MPHVIATGDRTYLLLDDGEEIPVTHCFDSEGDPCGLRDASTVVAGPDERGKWWSVDLGERKRMTIQ